MTEVINLSSPEVSVLDGATSGLGGSPHAKDTVLLHSRYISYIDGYLLFGKKYQVIDFNDLGSKNKLFVEGQINMRRYTDSSRNGHDNTAGPGISKSQASIDGDLIGGSSSGTAPVSQRLSRSKAKLLCN